MSEKSEADQLAEIGLSEDQIGKLESMLESGGSIDRALKNRDDTSSAVRYIMTTDGSNLLENALRYDIKDNQTVVAIASLYTKCMRNHYYPGSREIELILGLQPSIHGKRVNIFSDTVIGERKNFGDRQQQIPLKDKLRNFISRE